MKDATVTSVSIEEEVVAFLAVKIRVSVERLKPHTTLFGDLGVDGDDSDELLVSFMKRFGVDMKTYRGDRHFGPEGFAPCTPFFLDRVGVAGTHRERKHARELRPSVTG